MLVKLRNEIKQTGSLSPAYTRLKETRRHRSLPGPGQREITATLCSCSTRPLLLKGVYGACQNTRERAHSQLAMKTGQSGGMVPAVRSRGIPATACRTSAAISLRSRKVILKPSGDNYYRQVVRSVSGPFIPFACEINNGLIPSKVVPVGTGMSAGYPL